jgi:hypothetical protein
MAASLEPFEHPIAIGCSSSCQHHSASVAAAHLAGTKMKVCPRSRPAAQNSPAGGGTPSAIDPAADEPGRPTLDLAALRPMDRYGHLCAHALKNLADTAGCRLPHGHGGKSDTTPVRSIRWEREPW